MSREMNMLQIKTRVDWVGRKRTIRLIAQTAFPDWADADTNPNTACITIEGIMLEPVDGRSHVTTGYCIVGVQLSYEGTHYHKVVKRVMVKNDQIDIDAIRTKHAELKLGLAAVEQARAQEKQAEAEWSKTEIGLQKDLGITANDSGIYIRQGNPPTVRFDLRGVSIEKAKAIIAVLRG